MGPPVRMGNHRALALIAALVQMPAREDQPFGDAAKDLSIEEARRIGGRLERRAYSSNSDLRGPVELERFARKQRRGRQTKPGKRGKRARA